MQALDTGWGVKGMVFRGDEVLVLLNPNGGHDLPGGRLEGNETPEEGLQREIFEETGIKKVIVTNSSAPWSFRKEWGRLIKGTTWLCHFQGGSIFLSSEHSAFRWVPDKQLQRFEIHKKYGLDRFNLNDPKE